MGWLGKLTLEQIMDFLDEQIECYPELGEDLKILVDACNLIYRHAHKDDPEEEMGN